MNPVAAPLNFPARRQPENRSNVHLNAWGSKRYPTLFSLSPSKHQRPENMCEHRSFYNPNRGDPKGLRLQVVWESHTKIFKNPKKTIRKGCMYGISTYTLTIKNQPFMWVKISTPWESYGMHHKKGKFEHPGPVMALFTIIPIYQQAVQHPNPKGISCVIHSHHDRLLRNTGPERTHPRPWQRYPKVSFFLWIKLDHICINCINRHK